ncbi:P-loop containing nucleoside triphosphate hydrolases superfamily protein [Rhynchospora pubera]|uniref:P-loop containing nucleoside triphosphate hydrolases superfamily protein n=1 Tax=Rhynchospora pubera TaxID=906938 RepID=A0AAV8HTP6_9POAL|nr:P-loop containing nucleoside triphosphate hydrolases superfamily protein [Rhynchospora pubera]
MAEPWQTATGGVIGTIIVLLITTMARYHNIPFPIMDLLMTFFRKVLSIVYPYGQITINEYQGEHMQRDELYTTSEAYLSSVCTSRARKLKAELGKGCDRPLVTIDDNEEVTDTFRGTKVWWYSRKRTSNTSVISFYPRNEERKYYCLTFHKRHRQLVEGEYLNHILQEGRAAILQNRQRKLFTNNPSSNWYNYRGSVWSHVKFEHPVTFDTLAMDPEKKAVILDDLATFREGKEYYHRIGKAWKRGYLLYGPPGTGKSSMISAIANYLEYDVYDLELTVIKTNTELRKIFIETTGKSIIVIEDIDCSLDLTNKRKEKKKEKDDEEKEKLLPGQEEKDDNSKLTLSGLLNFIDGLCIRTLLGIVNITPADVAEGLLRKKSRNNDVDACLKNLISEIEAKKEAGEDAAKEKDKLKAGSSAQNALALEDDKADGIKE